MIASLSSSRRAFVMGSMMCLGSLKATAALSAGPTGSISPTDFGAKGDGVTDDYAAFKAADLAAVAAGVPLRIVGHHLIGTSYAVASILQWSGGTLKLGLGTVFTVNGLMAPAVQVFDLSASGRAVFVGTQIPLYAYAEWFGVRGGDLAAAAANQILMNAAILGHPTIRLLATDYFVAGRIDISIANHTLEGTNFTYDGITANQVTRLLCTSATSDILLAGLAHWPGSVNALPEGITVRKLYINRTVAPAIASQCDGIRFQFCRSSELAYVKSVDSINTLHVKGVVSSRIKDCRFARVAAGAGVGDDSYRAIWIDGSFNIGAAGGIASVYFSDCSSECNNAALQASGSTARHLDSSAYGFQDIFFDRCESVSCAIATHLDGASGGQADVRLRSITDDQVKIHGLLCSGLNETAVITLQDYYCGPSAGVRSAVLVENCHGSIAFIGGQLLLSGLDSVVGVEIQHSKGVSLHSTVISECSGIPVAITDSSNCIVEPEIVNNRHSSAAAAIVVAGPVTASRFAPVIHGQAGAFGGGIKILGSQDDRNVYDVGSIDSACLKGGAGQKLVRNGVGITASGLSDRNEIRGPMA